MIRIMRVYITAINSKITVKNCKNIHVLSLWTGLNDEKKLK